MLATVACTTPKRESSGDDKATEKSEKAQASDESSTKFGCGDKLAKLGKVEPKGSYTVQCPKGCTSGSIWGSGWYTTDSAVCVAAVHAGAIDSGSGGKVKVQIEKGLASYRGTSKNGVSTAGWGSFDSSFSVDGSKNGNDEPAADIACSDTFAKYDGKKSVVVKCPKGCSSGTVYGTDVYTSDSAICVAAVHAGKIEADSGGEVTVKSVPAESSYKASKRNGVQSIAWGSWPTAFKFE